LVSTYPSAEAFNPTIGAAVIAKEMRDDPEAARAEWGAELQMVEAHTPVVFVTDFEQRLPNWKRGTSVEGDGSRDPKIRKSETGASLSDSTDGREELSVHTGFTVIGYLVLFCSNAYFHPPSLRMAPTCYCFR
jgi:hypothetical protein